MSKVTLSKDDIEIEVWPLGARLNSVRYMGSRNFVDGAVDGTEARGAKLNHGSVAGPVANRIARGTFEIEGKTFALERDENGKTTLHSGSHSTRDAIWDVIAQSDQEVCFELAIPDHKDGFPGNRVIKAIYTLHPKGFDLRFEAKTDSATLMNLALHPYWTLATDDRDALKLAVYADHYLPVDDDKIPTGEVADVEEDFDLRAPKVPSPKIDHNFCLSGWMQHAAQLESDTYRLNVATDAPGIQIYTGKPFGIAIEPQHWPDAPHHSHFPSILLHPGETYQQLTQYRLAKIGEGG